MEKVRAKFVLTGTKNDDGSMTVGGAPVVSGSEENKTFNDATPSGSFTMHIAKDKEAQGMFGEPKEFYIDIEEAPTAETATASDEEVK